jgi:hypothetical protein
MKYLGSGVLYAVRLTDTWRKNKIERLGPSRSRFSVVFLDPRANAELVPKFHVTLHASHAALPLVISKFRPNIGFPPPNNCSKFYYNAALRPYALPILEGQAGTDWEPSKPEIYFLAPHPPNVVSLTTSPFLSLSLERVGEVFLCDPSQRCIKRSRCD